MCSFVRLSTLEQTESVSWQKHSRILQIKLHWAKQPVQSSQSAHEDKLYKRVCVASGRRTILSLSSTARNSICGGLASQLPLPQVLPWDKVTIPFPVPLYAHISFISADPSEVVIPPVSLGTTNTLCNHEYIKYTDVLKSIKTKILNLLHRVISSTIGQWMNDLRWLSF